MKLSTSGGALQTLVTFAPALTVPLRDPPRPRAAMDTAGAVTTARRQRHGEGGVRLGPVGGWIPSLFDHEGTCQAHRRNGDNDLDAEVAGSVLLWCTTPP